MASTSLALALNALTATFLLAEYANPAATSSTNVMNVSSMPLETLNAKSVQLPPLCRTTVKDAIHAIQSLIIAKSARLIAKEFRFAMTVLTGIISKMASAWDADKLTLDARVAK